MWMRPDTHAIFLSGYCNQRLGFGLAAPDALLDSAQVGLIRLHGARPRWSPGKTSSRPWKNKSMR